MEDDDNSSLNSSRTIVKTKDPKPYLEKILEKIRKKQKKKLKKLNSIKETNKFDYFFIICITTIIGYLGKYSINFLLDYILILIFKENYDKKIFLISTLFLYGISVCFSLFIYEFLYKRCIFIYENKEEKDKIIKTSKICGYIIYSEERKPTNPAKRNCCTLCFENIQNCFDNTFCYIIKKATSICCDWEPKCCCCCYCCCKYDKEDYNKKKEAFIYCYKTQRSCYWLNKFFENDTQRKILPFMFEYFALQLTTIGFDKHYEKNKNNDDNIIIWLFVFLLDTFL